MADVFISFARADEQAVARIAKAIAAEGFEVWWDAELPAHRDYADVIEEEVAAARAVLVLWSEAAARSQWVRAEADAARNMGKLVQASLDNRLPPMPFNQIQAASLAGWRGEADHPGWRKIRRSLAALAARTAAADAATVLGPRSPEAAKTRRMAAALAALAAAVAAAVAIIVYRGGVGAETNEVVVPPAPPPEIVAENLVSPVPPPEEPAPQPRDSIDRRAVSPDLNVTTTTDTNQRPVATPLEKALPAPARAPPTADVYIVTSRRLLTRSDIRCHRLETLRGVRSGLASRIEAAGGATTIEAANLGYLDATIEAMERRGENDFCS